MTPLLAATTLAIGYAALCWALPFGRCWRCKKTGSHPRLITRRLRTCRRCKGSGLRLRYGRRTYNFLARIHHDATTARTRNGASR
ncbi:hypothetical protein [Krasilnikovia sp. MM14-A1004]|uniref:hypothetical protein n=1 Tax=Krasilnikovia sp. MM14-A1004 TaxID=3373541 RepID=UPI00399D049C